MPHNARPLCVRGGLNTWAASATSNKLNKYNVTTSRNQPWRIVVVTCWPKYAHFRGNNFYGSSIYPDNKNCSRAAENAKLKMGRFFAALASARLASNARPLCVRGGLNTWVLSANKNKLNKFNATTSRNQPWRIVAVTCWPEYAHFRGNNFYGSSIYSNNKNCSRAGQMPIENF